MLETKFLFQVDATFGTKVEERIYGVAENS